MRKILPQFLIFVFFLVSCKKNNLSDTYWLAVKSSPIPPQTGYSVYNGMTLHFADDELIYGNVFEQRNGQAKLRIKGDIIFVNDTLWALTHTKNQDSLILDINENARVKFIKLKKENLLSENPQIWEHRNWILTRDDYKREIFLTDSLFFGEPNSKLCIQKDLQVNQFISTLDKWNIKSINGNQLFVKTFHQMDEELYRIKKYSSDSVIELETLGFPNVKTHLLKRKYLSETKRREIIDHIQNKVWKTERIISLDTISEWSRDWESSLIKLESLKNKRISFKFQNDSIFHIYESEISVRSGNWRLSKTGNEIILNNGVYPSDYIDLIKVNADSLTIGNLQSFEPKEDNFGMEIEMYHKIKLIK